MTCVRLIAAMALSGCHRAPVVAPGVTVAPPATFDLDSAERTLQAAEEFPAGAGFVLVTGMTGAGATPPGCARNWLDTQLMEPQMRLLVLKTAFTDGLCQLPCATGPGTIGGSASTVREKCVPDRFGTAPPAGLDAPDYLYAVLTVDGVHAALDALGSPRSEALRARFDALLPAVPTSLRRADDGTVKPE